VAGLDPRSEGGDCKGCGEGDRGVNRRTVRRTGVVVIALALTASYSAARAQGRDTTGAVDCPSSVERKAIAGVILDSASREPLPDADLFLSSRDRAADGFPRSARTDSLGRFCFPGLRAGLYALRPLVIDPTRYPLGGSYPVIEVRLWENDTAHHVTVRYGPFTLRRAEVARRRGLLAELEAQRRKWSRARPARYRLYVEVVCFCPPMDRPTFEVAGDSVVAIHGVSGARDSVLKEWPGHHTVEHLFDELEEELRNEGRRVTGVAYHQRYGFPIRYESVASSDPHGAFDDTWFNLRVTFSEVRPR
jgi:hypothetical protein